MVTAKVPGWITRRIKQVLSFKYTQSLPIK
jgi:hypothetical protein